MILNFRAPENEVIRLQGVYDKSSVQVCIKNSNLIDWYRELVVDFEIPNFRGGLGLSSRGEGGG